MESEFETIYENYRLQLMRKNLLIEMDDNAKLWDKETRTRVLEERDTLAFVVHGLSVILRGVERK